MRKIMAVGSSKAAEGATASPQAKLLGVVGVIALSGFIAGYLGIGGALVFNPFLLQLGVHPQVRFTVSTVHKGLNPRLICVLI